MSHSTNLQDGTGIFENIPGIGIIKAVSDSAPSNGAVGYAPGCEWRRYNTYSASAQVYTNAGTAASATWYVANSPSGNGTIASATITTAAIANFTGAESHAGVITPVGGIAVAGGTASPRLVHTGGVPAILTTSGTNSATNTGGTVYFAECFVPCNMSVTGVAIFNGTAVAGNGKAILYNSAGVKIAISASTAMSGTTAYQLIPFTGAPIAVLGPSQYWIGMTYDTNTHDLRGHVLGAFATGTLASTTYATDSTLTPIVPTTTFSADIGPIASLY